MSRTSQSGLAAQKTPAPVATSAKSHFDTFETKFFEQGDAGHGADGERIEEWEEPTRAGRMSASRPFLLGVAVGSLSVALLGGVGLWLTGARLGAKAPTAAPAAIAAAAEPVPAPPPAAPAPKVATSAPSSPAAQPREPVPSPPSPQPTVAGNSEPSPAPTPAAAATIPVLAEQVEPAIAPAEEAAPDTEAEAAPTAAESHGDATVARCKQAIDSRRTKEVLAVCPAAFAADPAAADIAVALAKIEFNRGRGTRAIEWGRKAIALDENLAEAYVFVGGGEQMAGHRNAAKTAYRRYLELAPKGRYAADVRAILDR